MQKEALQALDELQPLSKKLHEDGEEARAIQRDCYQEVTNQKRKETRKMASNSKPFLDKGVAEPLALLFASIQASTKTDEERFRSLAH